MNGHAIVGLVGTCLLQLGGGRCDTHYVSPDGAPSFPFTSEETAAPTIQEALDAAEYGDAVRVAPGEYRERLRLGEGVRLLGSGPADTVVITLEEGFSQAAITGAKAAEIWRLRVVHRGSMHPTCPVAIDLGSWPDQVVAECEITGNFSYGVRFSGERGATALVRDSTFDGCWEPVRLQAGTPRAIVDSCIVRGAHVVGLGDTSLLMSSSSISCDYVYLNGGEVEAVWCAFCIRNSVCMEGGALSLINCLLRGEAFDFAVGLYATPCTLAVMSCTIVNSAGISCQPEGRATVTNSILWGDEPQLSGSPASLDVRFSDVNGGWQGEGNLEDDPMFVDPERGDFRLRPASPCIDAGFGHFEPAWLRRDLAGNPRLAFGGRSLAQDMGAYEYFIMRLEPGPRLGEVTLTWSAHPDAPYYTVAYSDDLLSWHIAETYIHVTSWTDDGSNTGLPPSLVPRRFYRILENP